MTTAAKNPDIVNKILFHIMAAKIVFMSEAACINLLNLYAFFDDVRLELGKK